MSDPGDRKKQQPQKHVCVICAEVTSDEKPVCQRCLKIDPQDAFKNLPSETTQAEAVTWKPKAKKKKKKNKRKKVTEEEYSFPTLRVGLEDTKTKNVSQAKRLVDEPTEVPDKTGESFGTGWWKLWNPTTAQTSSSEQKDERRTYSDFYSDSDDDTEGIFGKEDAYKTTATPFTNLTSKSMKGASVEEAEKVKFEELHDAKTGKAVTDKTRLEYKNLYDDSQEEIEETSASETASATSVSLEKEMAKLKIEKTEHDKTKGNKSGAASDQQSSTWGKCSHCKKEGYVLNCSRCKLSSYCNRECQKSDYPQHKVICRRKYKFNLVQSKIPDALKLSLIETRGVFNFSQLLRDLPSEFEYACGARVVVMAEIVGPYFHLFRFGVIIRDVIGVETHILFYNKSDVYMDKLSKNKVRYPLQTCLRPGNFILLVDTHFHPFLDGTVGIRIDNLSQVYFIFEN